MSTQYQTYFILNEATGLVKIGKAINPERRLSELEHMNGRELRLLAIFPDSGDTGERRLHAKFLSLRSRGEWFKYGPRIKGFLNSESPVVFPVYPPDMHWTPICADCLRPIHPGSLQCRSCMMVRNRGGLKKPGVRIRRGACTYICFDCLTPLNRPRNHEAVFKLGKHRKMYRVEKKRCADCQERHELQERQRLRGIT